ncbi:MAG: hypothetical protein IPN76_09430 [Saprospiraceae bacterium]|nr:hypothetical protein [Saprospiraceae bacterium]
MMNLGADWVSTIAAGYILVIDGYRSIVAGDILVGDGDMLCDDGLHPTAQR